MLGGRASAAEKTADRGGGITHSGPNDIVFGRVGSSWGRVMGRVDST